MKQYNYIYKITNLTNGKIYIGKHSTDNLDDGYFGSGKRLKCAIRKYGIENFEKEIIAFCYTEDELNRQERFYIRDFNSMDSSVGYNMTHGGNGAVRLIRTEEHRKKISLSNTGKKLSEETRRKISESKKGKHIGPKSEESKRKTSNSLKGRKRPEETIKKMSDSLKGRIPWNKGKTNVISEETRQKMIDSHKGKTAWNKGLNMEEYRKKKGSQLTSF